MSESETGEPTREPQGEQEEDEPEDEPGVSGEPQLDVAPHGIDPATLSRAGEVLLRHPAVRQYLGAAEHRLLSIVPVEEERKSTSPCEPDRFRAMIYDYTNGRTVQVEGNLSGMVDSPDEVVLSECAASPTPTTEEFDAAVDVLQHDRELRAAMAEGRVVPYRPMPPTVDVQLPDGRIDRVLGVGMRSRDDARHTFVGVNMFSRNIIHDLGGLPPPGPGECEPPPGIDGCGSTGTGGQVSVTVTQGGQTVWNFVAVRPAASSGTRGSGIELRFVDYRGKRVLYRAHLPILNVEYLSDGVNAGCGPTYRDWQNSEACFQANGNDVIPGYRVCSTPAQTILDSGTDVGNFRGVAIYVQGQEVVLVSEMQAGWYRYISEWRLHVDGTIRPRFGFAGTDNPCTCHEHIHHAYWRFDFDIRTFWNNVVEEHNDPPIIPGTNWHTKFFEIRRPRDLSHSRYWRVSNAATGEGYLLVPGAADGAADAYGVGDVWVLRYHGNELDDGVSYTATDPAVSMAHLDNFISPAEPVANTDVVLWYVGHFRHDLAHAGGARVGPDLIPVNW
jgi:hypothetical protein